MWNPLDEETFIPELQKLNERLRLRYKEPCLELYNEYWAILMRHSIEDAIQLRSVGGDEFVKRMRSSHIYSIPIQGIQNKIQKELFVLHSVYKETIVPHEATDALVRSVETFLKNAPTYMRLIPSVLGYPKYKRMYGCCDLHLPSIPAIGFTTCLCQTYAALMSEVEGMRFHNEIAILKPRIECIRSMLLLWKKQEGEARKNYNARRIWL